MGRRPPHDDTIGARMGWALTRPTNVLPGAAVVAAGIVTGLWPLALAGVGVYGALTAFSYNDRDRHRALRTAQSKRGAADAAARGAFSDPSIRGLYNQAGAEYQLLRDALAGLGTPVPAVDVETRGLMDDVTTLCTRAQRISDYLGTVDRSELMTRRLGIVRRQEGASAEVKATLADTVASLDRQLKTMDALDTRMEEFEARMAQIISSLGAMRGEITAIDAGTDDLGTTHMLEDIASARLYVTTLADTLGEARPGTGRAAESGA